MTQPRNRLSADQVYQQCDAEQFPFETTASVQTHLQSIGQDRALSAIQFGINIQRHGYNLFALGPTGAGKYTLIREALKNHISADHEIFDWCYINNFEPPFNPIALKLPAGIGSRLRKDLQELSDTLSHVIPKAFEAESYDKQILTISTDYQAQEENAFRKLENDAKLKNIAFIQTDTDFTFTPTLNNAAIEPNVFDNLPEKEKESIQSNIGDLQRKLQSILQHLPKWQQESRLKVKKLNNNMAKKAVGFWVSDLKRMYKSHGSIIEHLKAIEENVIENVENFLPQQPAPDGLQQPIEIKSILAKYCLNLIVDNKDITEPPVVYEVNPTLENIIGTVDSINQYGTLNSDFTMIKAGALHKANGGYLILDAYKLLDKAFSWEALKRALASREINIETASEGSGGCTSLTPAAIPLDIKIILLGDHHDYFTLSELDPEFNALFKVIADFEDTVSRNQETMLQYAQLISAIIKRHELKPFHRTAIARVVEQSSRWIEDSEKLSTHTGELQDLMTEADYWATQNKQNSVTADNIDKAIEQQLYRTARLKDQAHQSILRDNTIIETAGNTVGQINALTVADLGEFTFGQPSRVTALARLGDGKIIDIEHEANLGGNIHTKGLLILTHFFGDRYLQNKPLSFNASIVFEQSYGGVDGDSASAAELVALMSAIGKLPIKQSIAITGAIDQHGNMLPIGGVNEKIEGFFEICQKRTLTGDQAVIIPHQNAHQLMLCKSVIDAVKNNQFHIYTAKHIDQALEILCDQPIGKRDNDGVFTINTINRSVEDRLLEFAITSHENEDHHHEDEGD
ncbi:MAG: AAA family ATPase [Gammaproteobacteria bacterium]|nr:AAA family ATPase [Gammaproteobacteria bacterium]